jgi:putative tryptophan/tyrosine transport system substrate-binding protein
MMRRSLLLFLGFVLSTLAAIAPAQQPDKIPVIGVLTVSAGPNEPFLVAFRKGLRERGYVEDQNIKIEHRNAQGQIGRLPLLAEELVQLKVDVILAPIAPLVRAAKQATSTIPIVMVAHDYDPVAARFIDGLSRPGGNITGISTLQSDLVGKRLELLKDVLPNAKRIAVLWDEFGQQQLDELIPAARILGLQLELIELRAPYDFKAALVTAKQRKTDAVTAMFSPVFYVNRAQLAERARAAGLPAIFQQEEFVEAGGLLSYGPDRNETFGRAAYFVDRILKGTKPADLPVEQPTRFRLVVNMKTAKALGVKFPESVLVRVDEVIK